MRSSVSVRFRTTIDRVPAWILVAAFTTAAGLIRAAFGEYEASWLSIAISLAVLALWIWVVHPRGEAAWTMQGLFGAAVLLAWAAPLPLGAEIAAGAALSAVLVYLAVDRPAARAVTEGR